MTQRFRISIDTSLYRLEYDPDTNRIVFTIRGYWDTNPIQDRLLADWREVLSHTLPGFTILADVTMSRIPPRQAAVTHAEIQRMLLDRRPGRVAELTHRDDREIFETGVAEKTELNPQRKVFTNRTEAITWLDGP